MKSKIDELLRLNREEAIVFIADFRLMPIDVVADKYCFPEGFYPYASATVLVLMQKHKITNDEIKFYVDMKKVGG